MRTVVRALLAALPLVALLADGACGGRVDGVKKSGDDGGPDAGVCPGPLCCGPGGSGGPDCSGPPDGDVPDVPLEPACPDPGSITPNQACTAPMGVSCPSEQPYYDCQGNIVGYDPCFCLGGFWECEQPSGPACQVDGGACPQPSDVQQDAACTSIDQICPGRPAICGSEVLYDAFQCLAGQWQDVAMTFCEVDGGELDAQTVDAAEQDF